MIEELASLFERDLQKLRKQIDDYEVEDNLWMTADHIKNSAGNICLHIIGNLNHYIGAVLGGTEYIRNRDLEFTDTVSKQDLLRGIEEVSVTVKETFAKLNPETLELDYPEVVFDSKMKTSFFLMHLLGHLNYHLGQINYHRRILCYN